MIRTFRETDGTQLNRVVRAINWQTVLTALGLFVVFFVAMALVQFSTPDMPDNDGFYHIRWAEIMRTEGAKPKFPYLPLTILNEREFYDHHFLFHVALMPFTFGDLRLGAKWAAVTFASLAFLAVWWLLQSQQIPFAWLWSLGLLAVSQAFLFRMSITRAQSLSLGVLALGLHWMLTGKYIRLLPLAFFYVWMYDAFPLLPVIAGLFTVAVWLVERRFEFRPLIFSAVGVVLGLIINPYFPVDFIFIFRHLLPKLTETTQISVGNEWYPYTTQQLLENSPFALLAFVAGIFAMGLSNRRMDVRTAMALLLSLLTATMLFRSRRFIEYFPAFTLIFAAFAWTPLFAEHYSFTQPVINIIGRVRQMFPMAALAVLVAAGSILGLPTAASSVQDSAPYTRYEKASIWLSANTPPGERIFQTDWDDFPRLFFYNTHNTYLVGLDPTYMQLYDPGLYDLWVKITQGQVDNLSQVIVASFGCHYVHTDLLHGDFIAKAEQDPNMVEVYRDNDSVIFQIIQ